MSKKLRYWQGDSPSLVGDGAGAEDWPWAKGMEMAKIMATMAAKTPNEMFETAIFLYLFLLCYYQKTLSLSKKKRLREREREREKRQRILEKSETNMQKNGAECRGTWEWYLYWEHEYRDCPHFYRIQHALWPSILYAIFFIEIPCNSKLLCFIKEAKEKVKQAVYMPFCCWCIWNLQSYFCVPTTTWEIIFNLVSIFSIKGMMMSDINVTN